MVRRAWSFVGSTESITELASPANGSLVLTLPVRHALFNPPVWQLSPWHNSIYIVRYRCFVDTRLTWIIYGEKVFVRRSHRSNIRILGPVQPELSIAADRWNPRRVLPILISILVGQALTSAHRHVRVFTEPFRPPYWCARLLSHGRCARAGGARGFVSPRWRRTRVMAEAAGMARLTWLSLPGNWSGRGRSHTASYPSKPRVESAAAPCTGPARPTAEGASAFPSKRQVAGSGNKVIALFYGAHVRPAIYGDPPRPLRIMQMVDDTCVRAHMEERGTDHRHAALRTGGTGARSGRVGDAGTVRGGGRPAAGCPARSEYGRAPAARGRDRC